MSQELKSSLSRTGSSLRMRPDLLVLMPDQIMGQASGIAPLVSVGSCSGLGFV